VDGGDLPYLRGGRNTPRYCALRTQHGFWKTIGLLTAMFIEKSPLHSTSRPQVSTANGNLTITATDNAKPTNSGGVYGHTLTFSEPGSNNLRIMTHADPTSLLVTTPLEGDPNFLIVREYKGYLMAFGALADVARFLPA
jgi:hypothetical protein